MVKLSFRPIELVFAPTDQDAELPDTDTKAHPALELADAAGQFEGVAVTVMLPDAPEDPKLALVGLSE